MNARNRGSPPTKGVETLGPPRNARAPRLFNLSSNLLNGLNDLNDLNGRVSFALSPQ